MTRLLYALLLAAPLAGQENPPFQFPGSVELKPDLVYARYGGRALRLDLYLPRQAGAHPAIIWVHGGGFVNGDKTRLRRHAAALAAKGFAGACIEYRLVPEALYPAQLDDAKAAVRWLRANAAQYRINPDRIGAAGGSSGGLVVAALGVNPDVSSRVQAVVALYPVTDLIPIGKANREDAASLAKVLGATYAADPALWAKASPVTHISKDSAPFFFLHGDADKLVDYHQSVEMHDKLTAAGVHSEIFIAKGAGHAFANEPQWFQQSVDRIQDFFTRTLQ